MSKWMLTVGFGLLLATTGCGQGATATGPSPGAAVQSTALPATAPTPTASPVPTLAPASATARPAVPGISIVPGQGTVTVSVSGIANGAHQVHVHRDCSGNPNLHLTTLGNVFVNPMGSGSQTFSVPASLRGRGFDLLVYPVGASQGPPDLCAAI